MAMIYTIILFSVYDLFHSLVIAQRYRYVYISAYATNVTFEP